ncbi:NUDIX hydrolase [Patescibacteria group bacterium]|nr:NUDIX hydrolase [Planctomycetota bacterium]MBU1499480.1 NUDIX hydrolase [Patescibacteria group bacterium]
MKYSGGLVKKEREKIFILFLENDKLKFNEIEKALKIRSNMVSYHLEQMIKQCLLEKKGFYYYLTKKAERYLPIIPHIIGQELSPLPIVLVALLNKDQLLLIKRKRRPYKDYWSLIGGKMLLEESFQETSKRLIKQKAGIHAEFESVNSVLHERVEGDNIIKHSFILFFTKMNTKTKKIKESEHGKLKWFKIDKIDTKKIIPSDLWLIKNKLNSKSNVKSARMSEKKGKLNSFQIEE